jgi:hypothetical protein
MRMYRELLTLPRARSSVLGGFVGRLPVAMRALGCLLLVSATTGSYAQAGVVAAAMTVSQAVAGPVLGRAVDRHGQRRVLLLALGGHTLALGSLVLLAVARQQPLGQQRPRDHGRGHRHPGDQHAQRHQRQRTGPQQRHRGHRQRGGAAQQPGGQPHPPAADGAPRQARHQTAQRQQPQQQPGGGGRAPLLGEGQDADIDHATLTRAFDARRVDPIDPDESLILLKATSQVAHQGGVRFRNDSEEYRILRDWIAAGAPGLDPEEPTVERLEVTPLESVVVAPEDTVPITAVAHLSDGTQRDVTSLATYEPSNLRVDISPDGVVQRLRHR